MKKTFYTLAMLLLATLCLSSCSEDVEEPVVVPEEEEEVVITQVKIDCNDLGIEKGREHQLAATVLSATGEIDASGKIAWSSSDTSVVVVSESGMLKALDYGTADITCSAVGNSEIKDVIRVDVMKFHDICNDRNGVDLGLPSGTRWLEQNIGSTSHKGYGAYVPWGEWIVWEDCTLENYKYYDSSTGQYTKYQTTEQQNDTLDVKDDVATRTWGNGRRLPTREQFEELFEYTSQKWTNQDDSKGMLLTSKINGVSIFLPAAGYFSYGIATDAGVKGYYGTRDAIKGSYGIEISGELDEETGEIVCRHKSCTLEKYIGRSMRPVCLPSE